MLCAQRVQKAQEEPLYSRQGKGGGQAPNYKGVIKDKGKKSKCNVCQDQCYHLRIAIQQMGKTKAQEGGKTGN